MSERCDLIVAGPGAARLAAGVTVALCGPKVTLVEKDHVLGGTTAWSGGWIRAPGNPVARRHGATEEPGAPRRHPAADQGVNVDAELVDAFLKATSETTDFFEIQTALRFDPGLHIPDIYGHLPGARTGGRSIIAQPFDRRALVVHIERLRPPLSETSLWGLTIRSGPDLTAFLTATRSPRLAAHVARQLARHLWPMGRHGLAMQFWTGHALVGRLLRSALDACVDMRTATAIGAPEHAAIFDD